MLKIIEIPNFDIALGDRDRIDGIFDINQAREIVKHRLLNEGDHAVWSPTQHFIIFKSVGGP
jgi:hypothetical protein